MPGSACVKVPQKKLYRQYDEQVKNRMLSSLDKRGERVEEAKGNSSLQCFNLLKYHQVSLLLHRRLLFVCNKITSVTKWMTALPS